jgi:hypothetical protein
VSKLSASQIASIATSSSDNVNTQRNTIDALYLKQNHLIDDICVLTDTTKVNVTEIAIQRVGAQQPMDLFSFDASAYALEVENTIAAVVYETHERPDLY